MSDQIVILAIDEVLDSHAFQVQTYGEDVGLRDVGLLESAVT